MRGTRGLILPDLARLARPLVLDALPIGGANPNKRLAATRSPAVLNGASESSTVSTPWLTITPDSKRRGAVHAVSWRQLSGHPGQALFDGPLKTSFSHALPSIGTFSISWRASIYNQFSEVTELDVAFTLTRQDPVPALVGTASPKGSTTFLTIEPGTRTAVAHFSVSVSGGTPPYFYDWGGGDFTNSPVNQTTIYLPPDASSGITFNAACGVTDSGTPPQYIALVAGPFFIYEGPPMGG